MRKYAILTALVVIAIAQTQAQVVNDLFQRRTALSRNFQALARKYQALEINTQKLASLKSEAPANLKLQLPFEDRELTLNLKKVQITSDNFSVVEALPGGGRRNVSVNLGSYYQGTVEGNPSSFATISISNDRVMGVIADDGGNIILGAIEDRGVASNEYTMYREKDLNIRNTSQCFTADEDISISNAQHRDPPTGATGNATGEPVEIYFECDFKMFQDRSSNSISVINYVLGFFNNVALLYNNEDIKVQVSQILVWTTQDPEAAAGNNNSETVLNSFRDRMAVTAFIGDYAHFLSTRSLGGGIAYILGNPCISERRFHTGVSAIDNTYSNFPTYSWTVEVVTHELGHNFGSNHTQWCGWVGGALDNCVATEPSPSGSAACAPGPAPSGGGTIMSYCHLTSNGINFNKGFGTQPGNRIRDVIGGAACFGDCRMIVTIAKQDASCNQNNGTATVTTVNNVGALTYLWSNGQTGATLLNAAPGTYHVVVTDAAANCKVTEDIVIVNAGNALTFSLTPSGTAGFCTGQTATLTATNNANYTYQWFLAGNPIGGATANTYVAASSGNYSVTATSGICSGTQSVTVTQVPPPTANVTVVGATTFCSGGTVALNGNTGTGYSYQWYNNGTAIPNATSANYSATTSGSYTLTISVGSACSATSSATVVTVNPSPGATVVTSGPTSFCQGGSVDLSASTGTNYTYQWYKGGVAINGAVNSMYSTNVSGVYSVVVSLGVCSKTSPNITVTVLTVPVVNVTPIESTIQKYQAQTLTATGAATYNWNNFPSLLTDNGSSADFKPLTTTVYTIVGTSENGCFNTAVATINVIGCGEVTDMKVTRYSPSRVFITWVNPPAASGDSLLYRKVGDPVWNKVFVPTTSYELNGLDPASNYEFAVLALCSTTNTFVASASQNFQTDGLQDGLYIRLLPNPVKSRSRLEVISSVGYSLEVAVFDNSGKRVMQLASSQNRPAGQTVKDIITDHLSNGVYIIALTVNGKKHQVKMLVAH